MIREGVLSVSFLLGTGFAVFVLNRRTVGARTGCARRRGMPYYDESHDRRNDGGVGSFVAT